MNRLLTSNAGRYRLLRTILQGIIGVLIANLDLLIAGLSFSPEAKVIIVPLVMAVLSPVMEYLGTDDLGKTDVPKGSFENRLHGIIALMEECNATEEEKAKVAEQIINVYEENGGIHYNDISEILTESEVCSEENTAELAEYILQMFKGEEEDR